MNVSNCRGCGRLFNALGNEKVCPACRQALDDKFQEVKQYLDDNPGSSIDTLSKECDVSVKQLKQWVREERLTFSENSLEGIECENCGTLIKTGRFCDSCKGKMATDLMSAYSKPKAAPEPVKKASHDGDKMRFI